MHIYKSIYLLRNLLFQREEESLLLERRQRGRKIRTKTEAINSPLNRDASEETKEKKAASLTRDNHYDCLISCGQWGKVSAQRANRIIPCSG